MINARLSLLRQEMKAQGIAACIIPTSDPHQSEYPPAFWKSREWISGFTGSAGTAVITHKHAGLWTDSRYYIVAENELANSEFVLHKVSNRSIPGYIQFLTDHLMVGDSVSVDGHIFTSHQQKRFEASFKKNGITLNTEKDLISKIWMDRPSLPLYPIIKHDIKYAGQSRKDKIASVKLKMEAENADTYLVTALDEIAWLLNLRGRDVDCNPVFISYFVIEKNKSSLFISDKKLSETLKSEIENDTIEIYDYDSIGNFLESLPSENSIYTNLSSLNLKLFNKIQHLKIINGDSFVKLLKSLKNETEIRLFNDCMIRDGVALTKAFYWLENNLDKDISEYTFGKKLTEYRQSEALYFGDSFSPIVGFNGNGAIIHYRANEDSCAYIKPEGILLVDSGGQYHDGTTDITRTFGFGEISEEIKTANTLVLKGHIALANAKFPEGTTGMQLDILARQFLWKEGLNFSHGTGHGVGYFLNVHEGPQGFSPAIHSPSSGQAFKVGMVTSNEPGYYKEGEFGIRIENLVVCKNSDTEGYLDFETITLFPFDTALMNLKHLTIDEIEWINNYHQKVYDRLSPALDEKHSKWLKDKCKKI